MAVGNLETLNSADERSIRKPRGVNQRPKSSHIRGFWRQLAGPEAPLNLKVAEILRNRAEQPSAVKDTG